jgi:thiol-disulfide isomerase/thioredoxin
MARVRLAIAVVCAGIALAGCGAGTLPEATPLQPRPTETSVSESQPVSPPVSTQPAAVPEQLNFSAKTVDGKDFSGASLAGKPAVLWFWAPWCPKCRSEAAGVGEAAGAVSGSVTFLGVAARDEVPKMQDFVRQYRLDSFQHLADVDGAVWKRFGVVEQPAYAFVKADGTVEVVTARVSKADLLKRSQALAG